MTKARQSAKAVATEVIRRLPDDTTLEDIMYALYVRQRIERGVNEADQGKLIPHEQVMQEAGDWLESRGRRARA